MRACRGQARDLGVFAVDPQHIAAMAVAMHAQQAHIARTVVATAHAIQRKVDNCLPRLTQLGGNAVMREQPVARGHAERLRIEYRTRLIGIRGAHGMDAADEAA